MMQNVSWRQGYKSHLSSQRYFHIKKLIPFHNEARLEIATIHDRGEPKICPKIFFRPFPNTDSQLMYRMETSVQSSIESSKVTFDFYQQRNQSIKGYEYFSKPTHRVKLHAF